MKKFIKITTLVIVIAVLAAVFVGCIPKNYEDAAAHLKKDEYTVASYGKDDPGFELATAMIGVDNVEAYVSGKKGDEHITILYFTSKKDAKNAYDTVFDQLNELISDDKINELEFNQTGKCIYFGTKKAIKAVK